jgi:1,2-diacylglycerol 3-beta-galactosyltransferase
MCESFARVSPGKPFVTVLTDFADFPPHFWMERQEQYFVCGSEKAVQQARQIGHREDRIFRVSGMVLNRRFYELLAVDRVQERLRLGLEPDRPTGIVLFGGQGARGTMLKIDRLLDQSGLPIQLIFICGKNNELREVLSRRPSRLPRFVEGFTTQVPYYMQLADFFIGKPGPGSVAEAVAMHLPVIVECNAWTLPQERYNTEWITENQVGIVVRSFAEIVPAVSRLLPELPRYVCKTASMQNRALFEIVDILKDIAGRPIAEASPSSHITAVKVPN